MNDTTSNGAKPVWIRGPKLRERWGDMANSTFYDRLKKQLIPKPHYPFGPSTPYWRLDEIEAHEQHSAHREAPSEQAQGHASS